MLAAVMQQIRMIESNLFSAMKTMEKNIHRMGMRGERVDDIEKQSNDLMESSYQFVERFDPWYVRAARNVMCCPKWWCRSVEESDTGTLPWAEL